MLFIVLLCQTCADATVWVSSTEPPIRIGVLQTEHLDETASAQAILLDKLRRDFHPRIINLEYLDWKGLENAIKGRSLDLILVNSPFYSTIEHEKGVKPLVGLIRRGAVDADHMLAGTLVTGKDNKEGSLSSVRGKELYLAASTNESNIVFRHYLQEKGLDEKRFFSKIHEVKGGVDEVFKILEKHPDAVGLLPACVLEEAAEFRKMEISNLKVIDEKFGNGLDCKRTTDVYPGWVLASIKQDDMSLVHKATASALTTVMADSLHWGFPPTNFTSIRNALIDLKYGPYAHMDSLRLTEVVYAHRYWVVGIFGSIVLIIIHSFILGIQVRRKTRNIELLMEEKIKISKEIAEAKEKIQSMEKFESVNQMSSMLAHELKQPLGAIRNYSRGLIRRADKNSIDKDVLCSALTVIVNQSDKAVSIVDQVRKYAKNTSIERKILDLNVVVAEAVKTFQNSYEYSVSVKFKESEKPLSVEINALEFQLVIINLLKNAAEAISTLNSPEINVQIKRVDNNAVVSVKDNGKIYSAQEIEQFFRPMFTTKTKGMGLGLTIVSCIVEGHGGRLEAAANPDGGLTFKLIIPLTINKP